MQHSSDAEAIKAKLIAQGDAIEDPGALGDDFMLQNYYPQKDTSRFRSRSVAVSPTR